MKILCYGDSNTYGYDPRGPFGGRYPSEHRWVDILQNETGWETINAGENGREIPRSAGEISAFQTLILQNAPDLLVILLGGNDLLQGASPEMASARMEVLIQSTPQLRQDQIALLAPPPKQLGAWVPSMDLVQKSLELAAAYEELAGRMGIRFANASEWNVELSFDGVHYTEKGHAAFARGLSGWIRSWLTS